MNQQYFNVVRRSFTSPETDLLPKLLHVSCVQIATKGKKTILLLENKEKKLVVLFFSFSNCTASN